MIKNKFPSLQKEWQWPGQAEMGCFLWNFFYSVLVVDFIELV